MPHIVTIRRLPVAVETMKAMQADGLGWGEDYRPPAHKAVVDILEGRMHEAAPSGFSH
jgi:hypothetical protein